MTRRVNIMLEDAMWENIRKIPKGERSRVINSAILEWFRKYKRLSAVRKMDALKSDIPPVSTEEIVKWIRADREHGS